VFRPVDRPFMASQRVVLFFSGSISVLPPIDLTVFSI
jgi:hypothetical protein